MQTPRYCPICGQAMERGGCRYCAPAPALFCNGMVIWLEWYELAGVRLARIKRVSKQEKEH